ncbi:MAG: hypothetical protein JW973_10355 [Bacteroidales bacterium]|nr:hypothetical protein [Bacteroidales bacterium]
MTGTHIYDEPYILYEFDRILYKSLKNPYFYSRQKARHVMMKEILVVIACFTTIFPIGAQEYISSPYYETHHTDSVKRSKPVDIRHVYIGIGGGIDYIGTMGFMAEFRVLKNLTLAGSAGIGSWGFRLTSDIRYYNKFPNGLYYSAGFNRSTGRREIKMKLETASGVEDSVSLELKPVNNINVGVGYMWRLWKRGRLNFIIGYAFDISTGDCYALKPSQPELSEDGKETITNSKPGGFFFGIGLSIGL